MSKGASNMFVETEKMELLPIRKTQRVLVRVPLSVSGKINDEVPFEEESFTISVNAAGGLLQLRKLVSKGQRLRLFQEKSRHQEFWHITFPPDDWTPRHPDSKFNRRSQLQTSEARECVGVGNC